jgi:hypothetical protein
MSTKLGARDARPALSGRCTELPTIERCSAAPGVAEPMVVVTDGPSVTTSERGGCRGLDGHKRIKGRGRHVL